MAKKSKIFIWQIKKEIFNINNSDFSKKVYTSTNFEASNQHTLHNPLLGQIEKHGSQHRQSCHFA